MYACAFHSVGVVSREFDPNNSMTYVVVGVVIYRRGEDDDRENVRRDIHT